MKKQGMVKKVRRSGERIVKPLSSRGVKETDFSALRYKPAFWIW
jgi:hypothetical protein